MRVRLYLDSRRNKDMAPVCLRVTVSGQTLIIATDIRIAKSEWDATNGKVVGNPRRNIFNGYLQTVRARAENALLDYSLRHDISKLSREELRRLVTEDDTTEIARKPLFFERYVAFAGSRAADGTKNTYGTVIAHMRGYDEDVEQRTFEEIDKQWLKGFEAYLGQKGVSVNTRSTYLQHIRAVFNDARDDEVTEAYPFRKFKIRHEATRKRSLAVEQLRAFFNAPVTKVERKYLDFFKLSFFLVGINMKDLCHLKEVRNGRIEYRRAKTRRLYSIKVEPEAMEIIERYRGKDWLLCPLDTYKNYTAFAEQANKHLREIGNTRYDTTGRKVTQPMFPDITMYWARHTWATIAASLDIPKETIAHALGHASAFSSVTDIYIDFDMRKVDEANRRVMDWVLYGKK